MVEKTKGHHNQEKRLQRMVLNINWKWCFFIILSRLSSAFSSSAILLLLFSMFFVSMLYCGSGRQFGLGVPASKKSRPSVLWHLLLVHQSSWGYPYLIIKWERCSFGDRVHALLISNLSRIENKWESPYGMAPVCMNCNRETKIESSTLIHVWASDFIKPSE